MGRMETAMPWKSVLGSSASCGHSSGGEIGSGLWTTVSGDGSRNGEKALAMVLLVAGLWLRHGGSLASLVTSWAGSGKQKGSSEGILAYQCLAKWKTVLFSVCL